MTETTFAEIHADLDRLRDWIDAVDTAFEIITEAVEGEDPYLEAPTHEEVQRLAQRFSWHPLDVEDVLSHRERPKVDVYTEEGEAGYLFAALAMALILQLRRR